MDKGSRKKIALERIDALFEEAIASPDADKYVDLARKIAMKCRIGIPKKYKMRYCSHCYSYGTSKARAVRGNMVYHCSKCARLSKFGYRRGKSGVDKKVECKAGP
jgi:ribonuclease P protein subunit RPR2